MLTEARKVQAGLSDALKGEAKTLDLSDVNQRLQASLDLVRKTAAELRRDSFDPNAVVAKVGADADKLAAWVRNETRMVPYVGALRGPAGVLMDRVGNSLDRALLLSRLIEIAGGEARLARSRLAAAEAQAALDRLKAEPPIQPLSMSQPPAALIDGFIQEYAQRFKASADAIRANLKAVRDAGDAVGREAANRATVQTAALLKVAEPRLQPGGQDDAWDLEALADHWWVQFNRNGQWIDIDPSGIVQQPRTQEAVTTLRPADVPDDLHHRLRIQVLIECACGGQLVERPALDYSFNLSEHVLEPVVIEQAPSASMRAPQGPPDERMWRTMRDWIEKQDEWIPALKLGGNVITQSAFTLQGEVRAPGTGGANPGGGILDAFGGGEESSSGSGQLTAEILAFELKAPGRPVARERRRIVDWISSRDRLASPTTAPDAAAIREIKTDLVSSTEMLPLAAQPSPDYAAHLAAAAALEASASVMQLAGDASRASFAARMNPPTAYYPAKLFELALARRQWNSAGHLTYIQDANLLTRHTGLRDDKYGPEVWSAFDIVYNRIGVVPSIAKKTAFDLRTKQGVLDTNIEVILDTRHSPASNISEVMANDPGRQWAVQAESGGAQTGTIRIGEVTANTTGDPTGYWRLDTTDGSILGMTAAGWGGVVTARGQGMTDFATTHADVIKGIGIIFKWLTTVACIASAVKQMLTSDGSPPLWIMARGSFKAVGCAAAGVFGGNGIAMGGALGGLYSRIGDAFSFAFTISSWIP